MRHAATGNCAASYRCGLGSARGARYMEKAVEVVPFAVPGDAGLDADDSPNQDMGDPNREPTDQWLKENEGDRPPAAF